MFVADVRGGCSWWMFVADVRCGCSLQMFVADVFHLLRSSAQWFLWDWQLGLSLESGIVL